MIFFDLETTGTSTTNDRIVQLSAITYPSLEKKKILINPTIPIPKGASDVHHITDNMVKDAPPFSKYSKSLHAFFNNQVLAGYNIQSFDIPLLMEEFNRCGLTLEIGGIVDCYKTFIENEPRTLAGALKFYCGKTTGDDAHDAEVDTLATIEVYESQAFMYDVAPYMPEVDIAGKIKLIDGVECYAFGKCLNTPVKSDIGFAQWMLKNDFTQDTKNHIRRIINGI